MIQHLPHGLDPAGPRKAGGPVDAVEARALAYLGDDEYWQVELLPEWFDTDICRCLDADKLIEVSVVHWRNQQKYPGDPAMPKPSQGPWFSPMEKPKLAGGWDHIRSHVPEPPPYDDRPRVSETEVPIDDMGGFFPKRSQKIISLWQPKKTPSYLIRLTELGRAVLARAKRTRASTYTDANRQSEINSMSDQLSQFGLEFAKQINADPARWNAAAEWLSTLPLCQRVRELPLAEVKPDRDGTPLAIVGLNRLPVDATTPAIQRFAIFDGEADAGRFCGPILRKLVDAWTATTARLFAPFRDDFDRFFDLGEADARHISLLAALSFNRDFDGSSIGLGWPWEHPSDCTANHEGRAEARALVLTTSISETSLVELLGVVREFLRNLAPPSQAAPSDQSAADDLLRFLADQSDELAPVHKLPKHLRDPHVLTVCDADGLIEFGTRSHCFVGPAHKLRVESDWDFSSITGPGRKPMRTYIAEAIDFDGDDRIRPHVRLTAEGRVRAARLAVNSTRHPETEQSAGTNDKRTAPPNWREPEELTRAAPLKQIAEWLSYKQPRSVRNAANRGQIALKQVGNLFVADINEVEARNPHAKKDAWP